MGVDYPGGDLLGVVEMQPTTDPPTLDAMNQPITNAVVVALVYGCVFEPIERGPVEEQTDTVTSHERAWAFLPYVQGIGIPTVDSGLDLIVDDDGNPVPVVITNANYIQPQRATYTQAQRNYKVFGLPELQYDGDGLPEHVWVTCEWRAG